MGRGHNNKMAALCIRHFRLRPRLQLRPFVSLSSSSLLYSSNKVTHTGQEWSSKDYRNARFIDRQKTVNEQFAINLVAEEPPVVVKGTHTWCDGGNDALGHPKVYINLDKPEIGVCGYCGNRFVSDKHQ